MRIRLGLLLLSMASVEAQTYPRPQRAITADVFGPLLFGAGYSYEGPLGGPVSVRTTAGVRGAPIFGGDEDLAVSTSAVMVRGTRWVAGEGGLGATVWLGDEGGGVAPHATVAVRLHLPLGRSVDGERVIERDVLLRLGASLMYDPALRYYDDLRILGAPVYMVPSLGVGVAF